MTNFERVKEFEKAFGRNLTNEQPGPIEDSTAALMLHLIDEEYRELLFAMAYEDLDQVAKELADLLYVVYDTAYMYGLPMDEVFSEVHRSNMTKFGKDGKVIYREDGKIMKSENYQPPDIDAILRPKVLLENNELA